MIGGFVAKVLHSQLHVGFSALQYMTRLLAQIKFKMAEYRRHTNCQIELFGIQRLYFCCNFFIADFSYSFSEAGH